MDEVQTNSQVTETSEPQEGTMEDFMQTFGISDDDSEQKPEENAQEKEPDEQKEKPVEENEANEANPKQPKQTPPSQTHTQKAQAAFAAMRVQNKKLANALSEAQKLLGINANSIDELAQAIHNRAIEQQAQTQKIPVELLQRLNQLEESNRRHEQEQLQQAAYRGFQALKDKFNLDTPALQQFASTLAADGLNPFEKPVDIVSQYITRNFDKLIAEAEERGRQSEIARSAKAGKHSASVTGKEGASVQEPDKVNTVSQLDQLLSNLK